MNPIKILLLEAHVSLLIGGSLGSPIFHLQPFPYNLLAYYPLQLAYGPLLKDLTLEPEKLFECLEMNKNAHCLPHGHRPKGGLQELTQAIDQAESNSAGPAHQSLRQLRQDVILDKGNIKKELELSKIE